MSNRHWDHDHSDHPRAEKWLAVSASSVVPAIVALFAPTQLFIPLCVVSAFLFAAGLLILKRQEPRPSRMTESHPRVGASATPQLQLEDE